MKLAACVLVLVSACASTVSLTAATYAAELQACVATSKTLGESAACRCAVSTRYERPCDDAGAP